MCGALGLGAYRKWEDTVPWGTHVDHILDKLRIMYQKTLDTPLHDIAHSCPVSSRSGQSAGTRKHTGPNQSRGRAERVEDRRSMPGCQTLQLSQEDARAASVCGPKPKRRTQERRKRARRQEASRREAARVMAAHRISPQWGGLGATGCVAAASALPRCQLSPLHALFDEEARRDRGARARVRRRACRAAALQPPATACGHHGTERRRHGQELRRPGAAGGLQLTVAYSRDTM